MSDGYDDDHDDSEESGQRFFGWFIIVSMIIIAGLVFLAVLNFPAFVFLFIFFGTMVGLTAFVWAANKYFAVWIGKTAIFILNSLGDYIMKATNKK